MRWLIFGLIVAPFGLALLGLLYLVLRAGRGGPGREEVGRPFGREDRGEPGGYGSLRSPEAGRSREPDWPGRDRGGGRG